MLRPIPEMSDEDFYRWYGPWKPLTPTGVERLMHGSGIRWWIVGGWAVDAFTGVPREHEDIDVSFFRADLPRVREHLSPEYCVWSNYSGTLQPMRRPEDLIEGSRQLWVRPDGASPWVMDLAMNPHEGDTWISARWERVRMPFDDATYVSEADGLRYLQPQIVTWMKAHRDRAVDARDLAEILPRLDASQLAWLRTTLAETHPAHPWLKLLAE